MNNGDDVFDVSDVVSSILEEIVNTVVNISRKNCTQKCPECEKSFSHQISLKRHLKEHTVELKYISKIVNLKLFVRILGGDIDGGFIKFSI